MLRSMYAGISGMKGFQTKLDVVGNNIANVNTSGFKKGRVTFQDLMSQTTQGAQGSTANRGGVNSMQVGLGSQVGSIDNSHGQGFRQSTGRPLDFAIEGNGMFAVKEGNSTFYTRAGNFYLDDQGTVVNADGYQLQGFSTTSTGGTYLRDDYLELRLNDNGEPTEGTYGGLPITNISETEENGVKTYTVENTNGKVAEITQPLKKYELAGQEGKWEDGNLTFEMGGDTIDKIEFTLNDGELEPTDNNFEFENGQVIYNSGDETKVIGELQPSHSQDKYKIEYLIDGEPPVEVEPVAENFTTANTGNQGNINIPLDAQSFSVDTDGFVNYVDTQGNPQVAGQIALANFTNPEGLEKVGSNLFLASANSGFPAIGAPNAGGAGSIVSNALEMSNVDLAEEFTEMITAQRGFQANTRIITTSDEILQELVNLKR